MKQPAADGSGFSLGLLPLLIAMPLMYWPRLLEGDTQPWVAAGALTSALFYWPRNREPNTSRLILPIIAGIVAALTYILRETDLLNIIRYFVIIATFCALWSVVCRGGQAQIAAAVRATIVIWFIVGIYQVIAIRFGLPIEIFGRFVGGRSGVPGLTAEPSFYGSISTIQMMYLISEGKAKNRPFIVMAISSVFLSGSLLSYLLLIVPLARLPKRYLAIGTIVILFFVFQGVKISETGLFNRFSDLRIQDLFYDPTSIISRDSSTNLRVGHVIFTLYDNFYSSIMLRNDISFRYEYNNWAFREGDFLYNGSDFILTSAGELIFRSGIFGLLLILIMFRYVWTSVPERRMKIEKLVFVILCFLSPVALANPFFVFYIAQRREA